MGNIPNLIRNERISQRCYRIFVSEVNLIGSVVIPSILGAYPWQIFYRYSFRLSSRNKQLPYTSCVMAV